MCASNIVFNHQRKFFQIRQRLLAREPTQTQMERCCRPCWAPSVHPPPVPPSLPVSPTLVSLTQRRRQMQNTKAKTMTNTKTETKTKTKIKTPQCGDLMHHQCHQPWWVGSTFSDTNLTSGYLVWFRFSFLFWLLSTRFDEAGLAKNESFNSEKQIWIDSGPNKTNGGQAIYVYNRSTEICLNPVPFLSWTEPHMKFKRFNCTQNCNSGCAEDCYLLHVLSGTKKILHRDSAVVRFLTQGVHLCWESKSAVTKVWSESWN